MTCVPSRNMNQSNLLLNSFSCVFQIFAGYYLLLGTNKKFKDYFDISGIFKNWNIDHSHTQEVINECKAFLDKYPDEILENLKKTVNELDKAKINKFQQSIVSLIRAEEKAKNIEEKTKKLIKLCDELHLEIPVYFRKSGSTADLENGPESDFFLFMRPFYIYFGVLSLGMLVLGGLFNEWHKLINLNFINLVSTLIYFSLLKGILYNKYKKDIYKTSVDPAKTFLQSIFTIFVLILIPWSLFNKIAFIGYLLGEETISYPDLQVFVCVFMVLMPILTHALTLYTLVRKYNQVKELKEYLIPITLIEVPSEMKDMGPTNIPGL